MELWVAIGFIMLVVVGSVVWIRPSPRDQKLAKWRRDAIIAGLKVRMQTLKAEPKKSGIREDVQGVTYEWYDPSPQKGDQSRWAVVKTQGWLQEGLPDHWSWHSESHEELASQITQMIQECPLNVNALERTPGSSRIIWDENGSEFDPQCLKSFLMKLQAIS